MIMTRVMIIIMINHDYDYNHYGFMIICVTSHLVARWIAVGLLYGQALGNSDKHEDPIIRTINKHNFNGTVYSLNCKTFANRAQKKRRSLVTSNNAFFLLISAAYLENLTIR